MGTKNEYLELLQTVARVNTIQQQLINTRDALDKELETYKRLSKLFTKIPSLKTRTSILKFVAEGIIDILEVEGAVVCLSNTDDSHYEFQFEGNVSEPQVSEMTTSLKQICKPDNFAKAQIFDSFQLGEVPHMGSVNQGIVFRIMETKYNYDLILWGFTSKQNPQLYKTLNNRDLMVFDILAQNTIIILNWLFDQQTLAFQLEKIKKSKRELNRLSLIATKTKSGVSITDKSGYITWVNKAFEDTTGYHLAEIVGKKPGQFLQGPLTDVETTRKIAECIRAGKGIITSITNYTKNGEILYILLEIIPTFDESEELDGFIALQQDITEQQEQMFAINEAKTSLLLSNDELKKTNSELDLIVYRISHDLRAPLVSIKGIVDLITSNAAPESNQEFLEMINISVNRLDDTIQGILDFSRNARLQVETEEVEVRTLINEIIDQIRYIHTHEISVYVELKNVDIIQTDRERFRTLMINLITNAFKYCRKNVESYIKIGITGLEKKLLIEVEDNGEGIAEKHLEKIFEMFYRATTSDMGSGLGLYICKEIATKMNGTISVESEKNVGTKFLVELPFARNQKTTSN